MKRDAIRELLEHFGPTTSAKLLRKMESEGVAPAAARKRLQRLDASIRRLQGYGLPQNQQLLYLEDQWLSPDFTSVMVEAWREGRSAHGNALAVLPEDGSALPLSLMHTRSGLPMRMKGQVDFERVLEQLRKLELIRTAEVPELGKLCAFAGRDPSRNAQPIHRTRAVLLAEDILLGGLKDWLRKMAFASYNAIRIRRDEPRPEFSRWPFDLVGPSYVRPLAMVREGALKNGFIVADVWLEKVLNAADIAGFMRKTSMARSMRGHLPFIGFLVADEFTPEAWHIGRNAGLIFSTPELLFGEEVQAALKDLVHVLTNLGKALTSRPELASELFNRLARIEGAAANLRGPLFELIVAQATAEDGGFFDLNKEIVANDGQRAEIDVLRRSRTRVRACECRGHGPRHVTTLDEIMKWRTQRVPRMRDWLLSQHDTRNSEMTFEYWTSAVFEPEAVAYINDESQKTTKYKLGMFDGEATVAELDKRGLGSLVRTMREHYLRDEVEAVTSNSRRASRGGADQPAVAAGVASQRSTQIRA